MTTRSSRPAQRSYPKGQQRRAQIIQAAFQAFGVLGYRNASMLQIAADCGVSRAGLLHHFPTKESLLEAVLEERDRLDSERFFGGGAAGQSGLEFFASMLRLVAHNQANPGIVSLFAVLSSEAADPGHPAHQYFIARYERTRGQIRRALRDLGAAGLLRPGTDTGGLETDLVALIDGLQIQWLLAPETVDMPARLRARLRDILVPELP
jgi:AcrR family transcriptional regulator